MASVAKFQNAVLEWNLMFNKLLLSPIGFGDIAALFSFLL